jgi:thiazole synthase
MARNPIQMAEAMKFAVQAGRKSFLSGRIKKTIYGKASSPKKGLI